ncbi:MAG: acyl-CoA thioesterase [Gammaproteobacteria bacterium]|nr:acyl-CoA thioesterase [Gammaproteobacteria bacterium]
MQLPDKEPVLRVPAMVSDSNHNGTMFGGWLMAQVDIAGSIPALRYAKGAVVTAAVNSMNFSAPLFISDLVSLYAEISHIGHSSITVEVDVWVERNSADIQTINVANASLVYVAIDEQGKPRSLPKT